MKHERVMAEAERQMDSWRRGSAAKPTVCSLASACGMSRQAVYRYHSGAISIIRSHSEAARVDSSLTLKMSLLKERLAREVAKSTALTALSGELAVALHDALDELVELRARAKRIDRSKLAKP